VLDALEKEEAMGEEERRAYTPLAGAAPGESGGHRSCLFAHYVESKEAPRPVSGCMSGCVSGYGMLLVLATGTRYPTKGALHCSTGSSTEGIAVRAVALRALQ
jgi:hypothetical protein